MILAAATKEVLFNLFLDLMNPLKLVDCVLETVIRTAMARMKISIEKKLTCPLLMSTLCDYESLLLNDGCTGVAVVNHQNNWKCNWTSIKC